MIPLFPKNLQGAEKPAAIGNGPSENDEAGLFVSHRGSLCGIAYRMIGDRDLAEDVVQEVFVAFLESRLGFRGASSLKTFLYRVVINKCIDVMRRRRNFGRVLEVLNWEKHGYPQDTFEMKDLVRRVLSSIEPEYRMPLILAEVGGMSYVEIAETLHLTPGAVRTRIFRCREKLRKKLKSMGYVE